MSLEIKTETGGVTPVFWEFTGSSDANSFRIQALGRNIQELHKLENLSKRRSEQLNILLETIQDGFFIIDEQLKITLANPAFARMLDKELDEIIFEPLESVIPRWKNTRSSLEIPAAIEKKQEINFETYNPFFDKWLNIYGTPFENGLAVFYRDISEQKKVELATQRSEANLQSLINNTRDMIWSIDNKYQLLTANSSLIALAKQLGNKKIEKGINVIDTSEGLPYHDIMKGYYDRALRGEHIFEVIELSDLMEDQELVVELSLSPIRDEENGILGVSCYAHDITNQELQQTALIRAIERYDLVSEVTKDALWDYDAETDTVDLICGHQEDLWI